jgi:hypothetical protein
VRRGVAWRGEGGGERIGEGGEEWRGEERKEM